MKLDRRRVLVTGGAGFVGSHLAERLTERECQVTVLDDLSNGSLDNLRGPSKHPGFRMVEGSVEDEALLERLVVGERCEVVFHLAALNLLRSVEDPVKDLAVNCAGTLKLLEVMRKSGRKPVMVYSSTGSVYGEPEYNPQDEGHPLEPVSPYGISKLAAEKYVLLWHKVFGVPSVALRYYNVYGPRQVYGPKGGVIGIFLSRAVRGQPLVIEGDGKQERCFTYVEDVVRANLLAAEAESAWGAVYNVGTSEITTIEELARLVSRQTGLKAKPEYAPERIGDVRSFQPDLGRARERLGYEPSVKLAEGLVKTEAWIREVLGAP